MRVLITIFFLTSGCSLLLGTKSDEDGGGENDASTAEDAQTSDGGEDGDAGNVDDYQRPYDCDENTRAVYHFSADGPNVATCTDDAPSLTGFIGPVDGRNNDFGLAFATASDSDDSVAADPGPALQPPLTIEAWVQTTTANQLGIAGSHYIASIAGQVALVAVDSGPGWRAAIEVFLSSDCGTAARLVGDGELSTGLWEHVAVVLETDSASLFVNGQPVGKLEGAACDPSGNARLNVGSFEGGASGGSEPESFGHAIDELRISDVARYTEP